MRGAIAGVAAIPRANAATDVFWNVSSKCILILQISEETALNWC